jgi:mycothiol synthase
MNLVPRKYQPDDYWRIRSFLREVYVLNDRRDLDLIVSAPDGSVAAFCTIWFDDVTRTGAFEPVATMPAQQRRGLGKAIMIEGPRRLQRLGATQVTVGSYSVQAGALYASLEFTEYDLSERWTKTW